MLYIIHMPARTLCRRETAGLPATSPATFLTPSLGTTTLMMLLVIMIMIMMKVAIIVIRLLLPYQTYCRSNYLAHYGLDGPLAEYQPPPSEYGNNAPEELSEVDHIFICLVFVTFLSDYGTMPLPQKNFCRRG